MTWERALIIDIEGHTNDLAITITFSDAESGEILESDIVVNANKSFADLAPDGAPEAMTSCSARSDGSACKSTYDLASVLTHEVGHFFGLDEDTSTPSATMFGCTNQCETHKRDLSDDDQRAIRALYPEGSLESEEPRASGCGSRAAGS
jgi:hypothetical protein